MSRLADFAAEHERIRADLDEFLERAVEGAAAPARAAWSRFAARLRAHAAMEEELLLPAFVALGLETTGCTAAILRADHAKLHRLVAETESRLAAAADPLPPRARVELVLGCRTLRELLEHHDERERAGFFPALDAALDPAARAALYASCARSQASAASREARPPSSCNS